jgi:large subunit ribosomal protein L13e
MGFGHNNVLHGNHFRKDWQRRVRTWFDQPGRKLRRRTARKAKATALGVRPLTLLRPAVRAQTVRYNRKVREGRGFTLAELKEAGIGKKDARGVGIVVDHRRRNLSEEGKLVNVERLKAYKERLIVFPRNAKKPKKGDSTVSLLCSATVAFLLTAYSYLQGDALTTETTRITLPLPEAIPHEAPRKITDEEREFKAYRTLRDARANKRHEGVRKIREAKVSLPPPNIIFPFDNKTLLGTCRRQRRRQTRRSKTIPTVFFLSFFALLLRHALYTLHKIWALLGPGYARLCPMQ